jgi:hypothetical protein
MRHKLRPRPFLVVAVMLAGLAYPDPGDAQNSKDKKTSSKGTDTKADPKLTAGQQAAQLILAEAAVLREAVGLVAQANHDYDGHRLHALGAIKSALADLDGRVVKLGNANQKKLTAQGQKAVADVDRQAKAMPRVSEPQPESNKQLRLAKELLESRRGALANYNLPVALKHVNHAVRELGDALRVAVTHLSLVEARKLREAFVLLARTNHNYGGERVKALAEIQNALKPLDEFVLKHGNAAQKTATQQGQEAVREAERRAAKLVMVNEPQPASDQQLRDALALLAVVRDLTAGNNQPGANGPTQRAAGHVSTALKIN